MTQEQIIKGRNREDFKANAKILRENGYKYNPGYKAYLLKDSDGGTVDVIGIPILSSDVRRFVK